MKTSLGLSGLWRRHGGYGIAVICMILAGYTAVLGVTLGLRFQQWPNYFVLYPWWDNLQLILAGTPAWHDAWQLMLDEAWLELGFQNPDYYGIAEWSFALIPARLLGLVIAGGLFSTILLYYRELKYRNYCALNIPRLSARNLEENGDDFTDGDTGSCTSDKTDKQAAQYRDGMGKSRGFLLTFTGGLIGLTSVTISWVVCCATPTWAVYLAILGLSTGLTLQIEPFGNALFIMAFCFLVVWVALIKWQLSRLPAAFRERPAKSESSHRSPTSGKAVAAGSIQHYLHPGGFSGSLSAIWQHSGGIRHGRQQH